MKSANYSEIKALRYARNCTLEHGGAYAHSVEQRRRSCYANFSKYDFAHLSVDAFRVGQFSFDEYRHETSTRWNTFYLSTNACQPIWMRLIGTHLARTTDYNNSITLEDTNRRACWQNACPRGYRNTIFTTKSSVAALSERVPCLPRL